MRSIPNLALAGTLLVALALPAFAANPTTMNVQGQLTDSAGDPVATGLRVLTFRIFDAPTGGTEIWPGGAGEDQGVFVGDQGLWNATIGTDFPLTDAVFSDSSRYLEISISDGVNPDETLTRIRLDAVPYTFHSAYSSSAGAAKTADTATVARTVLLKRDLYHSIVDINPLSTTRVYFFTYSNTSSVSLYLYGGEFQGASASHTHTGNNAHTHTFTGSSGTASVSHTHTYSGTSASGGATHSHTGTVNNTNLAHSHSLNSMGSAGSHGHDFKFVGQGPTGPYLVHSNDFLGLSTSPNTPDGTARLSVQSNGSHSHSLSLNNNLGNHNHTFGTSSVIATHTHGFSGTSASADPSHAHSITGSIGSIGAGLSTFGIGSSITPTNVAVYVDGLPATGGPYSGTFSTGLINLLPLISAPGEHELELREEGGTGGRLTYNLIVE